MEMRFNRNSSKEIRRSTTLQKQMVENRKPVENRKQEPVPDLTELMNDWFFGSVKRDMKTEAPPPVVPGGGVLNLMIDYKESEEEISPTTRTSPHRHNSNSNNSRLTQEWLFEAKRLVASSPARCDSPSRLIGSPRFAATKASDLDRRDPLSRSARRHRAVESFSNEILSKSAKHTRNRSETTLDSQPPSDASSSPTSTAHQWFSNILNPDTPSDPKQQINHHDSSEEEQPDQTTLPKPPRQPIRKSRFRDVTTEAHPPQIQSRRTFKPPPITDNQPVLSPPKNLIEPSHRRTVSSSTCALSDNQVLSPPRNFIESAHRRSISSSTCSLDKISSRHDFRGRSKESSGDNHRDLNVFLKEQKSELRRISNLETSAKAKIVLSGSSNSTSSMVAAICYAWLLEKRIKETMEEDAGNVAIVVPVMNIKRSRMWKHRQAAWLFHHVGLDATSLLFADEVDLESLMMARRLNMMVVGQDVLQTNGEVGSQCTILTDNYCEDAYDMLQIPILKKLLLAGILLDTENQNLSTRFYMNRDTEAVHLLLVGSPPSYRNTLFEQLMQDQRDRSFLEAMRHNYGKPPPNDGGNEDTDAPVRKSVSTSRQGTNIQNSDKKPNDAKAGPPPASVAPARAPEPAQRPKNKFSIAKWLGFGK